MKQQVIEYLQSEYSETQIDELVDAEITSGNWVDSEDLKRMEEIMLMNTKRIKN